MQGSTNESHIQTHMGLILLRVALGGVCVFSTPFPSWSGWGIQEAALALPIAFLWLPWLLCCLLFTLILNMIDLFHPRRPSRPLWLLPCLRQLPTASHSLQWSILLQAVRFCTCLCRWSPTCGEMAPLQHPVESSSWADRSSVFSSNVWCSVFPTKSSL